jgi:hypothetical protein
LRTIWTESKPEHHGKLVDFGPMMTWPKPVQKPHPPIIVGGGFPYGARRAIAYGDGWMPIGDRIDVVDLLPRFRQMAAEAGREPGDLPVTSFGLEPEHDKVARTADAGIDRVVFGLPPEQADTILPMLDKFAAMSEQYSD